MSRSGRVTLGLYNSYDSTRWAEAHRRVLARAAPVAMAFEMHLAAFGFPFHKLKEGTAPEEVEKAKPEAIAQWVAEGTTIGEDGTYFVELAKKGFFHPEPFPRKGFPAQYGDLVLATRKPLPEKSISTEDLADEVFQGKSILLLVGLGHHGVPDEVRRLAKHHWDLTRGKELSFETATAIGAAAATLHDAVARRAEAKRPTTPVLSVDGAVVRTRGGQREVVLVKRGHPPYEGQWVLPGGFVDVGETVEQAAVREVLEETGLHARVKELLGVYSDPERDPRWHTVGTVFVMEPTSDAEPRGGSDAKDAKWFPLDATPPLAFDHEKIVADLRERLERTQPLSRSRA